MKTRITMIGLVAVVALLYAVKFSLHSVRWVIGLLIAVPVSAAITAGLSPKQP